MKLVHIKNFLKENTMWNNKICLRQSFQAEEIKKRWQEYTELYKKRF